MKRPPGTAILGGFVLLAAVLLLATIIVIGGGRLFSQRTVMVTFFDESVHGLDVGAPVKFRGVRIGQVTGVGITRSGETGFLIPVTYEIEPEWTGARTSILGSGDAATDIRGFVDRGLRARLQVQSFLTGLLYIEIDFLAVGREPVYHGGAGGALELPAQPSPFAEIGQNISDVTTKLATIDFTALASDLQRLLATLNERVEGVDLVALTTSFREAADAFRDLARNPDTLGALARVGAAADEVRALAADLREQAGPATERLAPALAELEATLVSVRAASDNIRTLTGPQGGLGPQMADTLRRLSDAADSLRALADFLEQHPNALLSGRRPPPAP